MADDSPDANDIRETSAWGRTLSEAEQRADALVEEGWDATTVRAGHLAPVGPEVEGTDTVGLAFIVPSEEGEDFEALVTEGVTDYVVYAESAGGTRYLVVEVRNEDAADAVLLVGAFPRDAAAGLREHARSEGTLRAHVRALDETHYGTVEFDNPEIFFDD
ncbi:DUF7529 family protein [Salarchaeum japonicum]|uniref:Uncharacterized protein n=1 Tax=Salarchaeum japonicum TaxID=555573 RepID=A0AAV3T3U1_9EURY|nr:hypothetical protein [Salarchaeum japonicum]